MRAAVGAVALAAVALSVTLPAAAARPAASTSPRSALGHWTELAVTTISSTPTVYQGTGDRTWILWSKELHANAFTYEYAIVAASGAVATKPTSTFGASSWGSLSDQPTLVTGVGGPIVVFDGIRGSTGPLSLGCIYGAQSAPGTWAVEGWSLSSSCSNPVGGAAAGPGGMLAAAWPGGWAGGHGVAYHLGASTSIPASGSDGHIPLATAADATQASVTSDLAGSGHFYVAWAQSFDASQDGYWAKDVTAKTASAHAPGSGTNSANISPFAVPAIAATNTHPGVFVVYCSNGSTCTVRLWHVGTAAVRTVPGSTNGADTAVSAGPGGRLWIAWFDRSNQQVALVRTNKADTAFTPVQRFKTPCVENGLLGLSGGADNRLTIALQCVNQQIKIGEYVTQAIVGLQITPSTLRVPNTASHTIAFHVTDVGDAVAGATIVFHGHSATTNAQGVAKLVIPKGMPAGTYPVVASAANYASAAARITVLK